MPRLVVEVEESGASSRVPDLPSLAIELADQILCRARKCMEYFVYHDKAEFMR